MAAIAKGLIGPLIVIGSVGAAEEDVSGEGYCVPVVEDNASVGESATEALKELGFDSVLAIDAGHALAARSATSAGSTSSIPAS